MTKWSNEYINATRIGIKNIEILIEQCKKDIKRYEEIKTAYEKQLKE